MKNKKVLIVLLVLAMCFVTAFAAGCQWKDNGGSTSESQTGGQSEAEVTVESISLDKTTATIKAGDSLDFDALNVTVTATKSDGTTQNVKLAESMFSADELQLLADAGEYDLTVSAFGKTATFKVTVEAREFENLSADPLTAVYDGKEKTPLLNAPLNAKYTWKFFLVGEDGGKTEVDKAVDAGNYEAVATVTLKNYKDATVTTTVTISKKTLTASDLTWNNTVYMYNGKDVTLNAEAAGLPFGVEFDRFEGDVKGKDVGSYTAKAFFKANANYVFDDNGYDVNWTITSDYSLVKWYAVNDGAITSAQFNNTDETKGTLSFNGLNVEYTVQTDSNGLPKFTVDSSKGVNSVKINGDLLSIATADANYFYVSEDALLKYYSGNFSTLIDEFDIEFDTEANTALLKTAGANGESSLNLTLTFEAGATDVTKGKLLAEGENYYFEYYYYSSSYYGTTETLKLYNYENSANFGVSKTVELAKKADVDAYVATLVNGNFVDYEGNTLVVGGLDNIVYNGSKLTLWAENYYGAVRLNASINSNSKEKEFAFANGYYKFSNAFADSKYKPFFGKYFLNENAASIDTKNTVSFMEYSTSYDVRFASSDKINGASSKTFTFGKTEGDRVEFALNGNVLTAKVTFADGTEMDMVFNADGSATFNGKNYTKYDKLFPSGSSYSPKKFYSADGKFVQYTSSYSGNSFVINGKTYLIYGLSVEDGVMTLTFTDDDGTETKVVYDGDDRYVKVDGEYYLCDDVAAKTNGFNLSASYVNGDDTIATSNGAIKVNGTALTDLVYSVGADGRKLLTANGKLGDKDYAIEFYTTAALKVTADGETKTFINSNLEIYKGVELKSDANATDKVFMLDADGKMTMDGIEVFPTQVSSSRLMFNVRKGDKEYQVSFDLRPAKMQMVYNDGITYNLSLVPSIFFVYDGLYKAYDGATLTNAFFFNVDVICYAGTYTETFSIKELNEDGAIITLGGKDAEFIVGKNGVVTLFYDSVKYTRDDTFDISVFNGKYSALKATGGYGDIEIAGIKNGSTILLKKMIVLNGEIVPMYAIGGSYSATNYYIIKNNDAATSATVKYFALEEGALKFAATGKIKLGNDTSATEVAIEYFVEDGKPVAKVTFGGQNAEIVTMRSYAWNVKFGGVEYYVQTDNSGFLKIYDYSMYNFEGRDSELFGNKIRLDAKVNANGESVLLLTFNGVGVNYALSELANGIKVLTFTADGKEYTAYMSSSYASGTYIRPLEKDEKEFFFDATLNADGTAYKVSVGGKDFEYMANVETGTSGNKEFVFDVSKTKYDGKAVTMASYSHDVKKLFFATEDGTYAYNLATKALETIDLGEYAQFAGVSVSMSTKVGWSTYTTKFFGEIAIDDNGNPFVKLFVSYGTWSMTTAEVENPTFVNGALKINQTVGGTAILAYVLKGASGTYGIYGAEQYELPGNYTVGGKTLKITATFDNGNVAYAVAYGDGAAANVTPDFTNKKFDLTVDGKKVTFQWSTVDGNNVFTMVPENAKVFELTGNSAYFCDVDSNGQNRATLTSILFKEVNADGKIVYNVTSNGKTFDGVLSDDESYITVTMNGAEYRIYKNAKKDEYYQYVAVKTSSEAVKYLGTFDNLTIALYGESKEEYDDDYEEYDFAGCKAKYFVVTYNGSTVTVKYDATVANGIEFTAGGKTYVAKLSGETMSVTEKTAA